MGACGYTWDWDAYGKEFVMMHGWDSGWFGVWWWFMPLVGLAVMVLVVGVIVGLLRAQGSGRYTRGAEALLDERYARGEIDDAEYRRRRAALRK